MRWDHDDGGYSIQTQPLGGATGWGHSDGSYTTQTQTLGGGIRLDHSDGSHSAIRATLGDGSELIHSAPPRYFTGKPAHDGRAGTRGSRREAGNYLPEFGFGSTPPSRGYGFHDDSSDPAVEYDPTVTRFGWSPLTDESKNPASAPRWRIPDPVLGGDYDALDLYESPTTGPSYLGFGSLYESDSTR
jgi:hypothetical protein